MVSYRFIAEDYVNVGKDFHHWLLEELHEEWRRQVHGEGLVVVGGVLGYCQDRLGTDSQRETLQASTHTVQAR